MLKITQWIMISVLVALCGTTASCAQIKLTKETTMEKIFPVNVIQSVAVVENSIIVTVDFENISNAPVLIMEGLWGIKAQGRPQQAYALAEPEFSLTSGGKQIEYIGPVVKRLPFTRKHFVLFNPGEKSSRLFQIAGDFQFLPGEHEYEIVHYHLRFDEVSGEISKFQSQPVKFRYTAK